MKISKPLVIKLLVVFIVIVMAFLFVTRPKSSNYKKAKQNIQYFDQAKDEILVNYNTLQNIVGDRIMKITLEEAMFNAGLCEFDQLGENAFAPFLILDQMKLIHRYHQCQPFVHLENGIIQFVLTAEKNQNDEIKHVLLFSEDGMDFIQENYQRKSMDQLEEIKEIDKDWYYGIIRSQLP